ncbi:chemotaxis protein CheW [Tabrizicola sp. TH137]|nr:chemotaxis protein CheW [Tabrizicola sp. TH137]
MYPHEQGPTPQMQTPIPAEGQGQVVLIFRLCGEDFALPVSCVHEILDPLPVTHLPGAADHVPGLVNVRGTIVPLFDARRRLRMSSTPAGQGRMIVIELPVGGEVTRLALLADSVEEVAETDLSALSSLPELGARWPARFLRGVARRNGGILVLLDPETLFQPEPSTTART